MIGLGFPGLCDPLLRSCPVAFAPAVGSSLGFALVVLGGILQAIRTLIWDLSYFLPGWLITPILLLGLGLLAAVAFQVGWPWWRACRGTMRRATARRGLR